MTERSTHMKLSVDVGSDPISGSLIVGSEDPRPFCGWIELVAEIEAVRYNGGDVLDGAITFAQPLKRLGEFPGANASSIG